MTPTGITRRTLARSLPLLAAASAAEPPTLPSRVYRYQDLPVKQTGQNASRAVFDGKTRSGFHVDMHMTELAPGQAPHPPHQHAHEEILMLQTGTLDITIDGQTTTIGPGSTVVVASGRHHGWRNSGDTRAQYFVMALGRA